MHIYTCAVVLAGFLKNGLGSMGHLRLGPSLGRGPRIRRTPRIFRRRRPRAGGGSDKRAPRFVRCEARGQPSGGWDSLQILVLRGHRWGLTREGGGILKGRCLEDGPWGWTVEAAGALRGESRVHFHLQPGRQDGPTLLTPR